MVNPDKPSNAYKDNAVDAQDGTRDVAYDQLNKLLDRNNVQSINKSEVSHDDINESALLNEMEANQEATDIKQTPEMKVSRQTSNNSVGSSQSNLYKRLLVSYSKTFDAAFMHPDTLQVKRWVRVKEKDIGSASMQGKLSITTIKTKKSLRARCKDKCAAKF